jgi:hypothetical protein
MYEHPSIQMELVKQRQSDLLAEADRHRLASTVERGPSETVSVLKSVVASLKNVLSRRPVVVRQTRLQPTS